LQSVIKELSKEKAWAYLGKGLTQTLSKFSNQNDAISIKLGYNEEGLL
jgi:hypothetical protein